MEIEDLDMNFVQKKFGLRDEQDPATPRGGPKRALHEGGAQEEPPRMDRCRHGTSGHCRCTSRHCLVVQFPSATTWDGENHKPHGSLRRSQPPAEVHMHAEPRPCTGRASATMSPMVVFSWDLLKFLGAATTVATCVPWGTWRHLGVCHADTPKAS